MEFTQIQEISSFSLSIGNGGMVKAFGYERSFGREAIQKDEEIVDGLLFEEVMKNLGQLTTAQLNQPIISVTESHLSADVEEKNIRSTNQTLQKEDQTQQYNKKYDRTKSTIFNNSLSSNRSFRSPTISQNLIKVFFFGTPIMKLVPYSRTSTIRQLIQRSLNIYLLENNDTIRASQAVERFEMRLPVGENDFCPDMGMEPIHGDRILSENMFETLVLCEKLRKETAFQSKPTKEYSLEESSISCSSQNHSLIGCQQMIKFILMDETYYELMRIELDKQGTLQKLFKVIQQNDFNQSKQFLIKDDIDSEFSLSPDHEVKLIEKNRLYLMTKKYLDQAEDEVPGPIRLKTLIQQEVNYLPPIGINEASRYEEFQVTKISSMGIAIQRILGIDQTKIYNYQKQLRQQKREASMVDKFLGFNNHTGTKKPFRFIKEIKEIKKFPGGIQVVYPEKITTFIIKNELMLEKIYRKLSFLLDLNKVHNSKEKVNLGDGSSSKKSLSFFKF